MAFFQNSVLKKHLRSLDETAVNNAYAVYASYFHNPTIQQNIRDAKEEQFQEGFLRELFVNVLGYKLNPSPDFNLTTELKNQQGAKKADGAILKDGQALGVIELKGTDTKDLDKINAQAFNYKNNQSGCVYVLTSNFEKLRFYIHHSVEHIEFNLFVLSVDEFKLMWLCLQADNLLNGLPLKVKQESLLVEEQVTKNLYKDYSAFKTDVWKNLVKNHPETSPLQLFKRTQKLLDRFLFIFFSEDKGLLPPNSISKIVDQWKKLIELDEYKPLYECFKKYFGYLDQGWKGKNYEIYAYNGGLFKPDLILDNLVIDDDVLHPHVEKLTNYDFESEVDVNILGHIFENSLNEIEHITAQLEGQEIDNSKTKRKKDGVFYTPKYITKYIVDNTVGRLCEEKKAELQIVDEEYAKGRRKRKKDTIKALDTQLQAYRQWLLDLTICDPACGSGAFLNQALEFLMHEHAYIDELESQLLGHDFQFPGVENHILEKNLFGVDINEESVEIAKLSLWLRTAQKGRKLTTLSNNIKCGNSLIDDPEVAGDKAFDWQQAFPQVFKSGARSARSGQGFDAVIGNPPYVSSKGENFDDKTKEFLTHQYNTAAYQIDLYMLFMERGLSIQKLDGLTSFIVPNSWLNNLFLAPVRKYLLTNSSIYEIVTMASGIFESANVDTVIVTYTKKSVLGAVRLIQCVNSEFIFSGEADKNQWLNSKGSVMNVHLDKDSTRILDKLEVNSVTLSSITEIARGVGVYHKRVGHTKELIAEDPYQSANKKDETFVPYLRGKNLSPYLLNWNDNSFISYGKWLAEPRESKYFNGPRIVLRQIPAKRLVATYLDGEFITDQSVFIAKFNSQSQFNPKAVLCILNSELMSYYFRLKYSEFDDLFPKVKLQHFKDFPIVKSTPEKTSLLGKLGESRLSITKENSKIVMSLISLLQSKFNLEKPTTKLQNWHELDFKTFLAELKKAKVALSLSEEAEWMAYFNEQKQKAQSLKAEIDKTDGEIDRLVYELYDLTEEEIRIVEQADKYE